MEKDKYIFCKPGAQLTKSMVCFDQKEFIYDDCEGESCITRVNVELIRGNNQKKVGLMILKSHLGHVIENHFGSYNECTPESMEEKYLRLKKAGLPIPPTFRIDKRNHRYLMTDMTANGQNLIVDKHSYWRSKILIKNWEEIKDQTKKLAVDAYKAGVFLSLDAYSIIFDKSTETGRICILDFGMNSFLVESEGKNKWNTEEEAIKQADDFLKIVF